MGSEASDNGMIKKFDEDDEVGYIVYVVVKVGVV